MPKYPRVLTQTSIQLNERDVIQGVHPKKGCTGTCYIHNKSRHPLRHAPLKINMETGMIERMCEHNIGHPDVDYLRARQESGEDISFMGIHHCDGCCTTPNFDKKKQED